MLQELSTIHGENLIGPPERAILVHPLGIWRKDLQSKGHVFNHDKSAAIYTQVGDLEDEINGVVTYDRKHCKLTPKP